MALEMLELDRQCVDLAIGLSDEFAERSGAAARRRGSAARSGAS